MQVRTGLGVLRVDGQGAFEVVARLRGLSRLGVEDAEIAPAVGIFLVDPQGSLLLSDRVHEITACGEGLRQQRVAGGI